MTSHTVPRVLRMHATPLPLSEGYCSAMVCLYWNLAIPTGQKVRRPV